MPHLPTEFVHRFEDKSLLGSSGTASVLAFSANGRLLALGGTRPTVDLWDVYEPRQVAALSGHAQSKLKGTILSLAFSPDGRLLASGGHDKTVRLWSAANGECVSVLSGFGGGVKHVAFHPAARVLAAADDDAVRLFDLDSGVDAPVPLTESGNNALAFSPDGSLLAVAQAGTGKRGSHPPVALVDPASGQTVRTIGGDEFPAKSLAFSPDGSLLAVVSRTGSDVRLWDTSSWQITRILKAPSLYFADQVAFSAQGALGAALGERVALWDPGTEEKPVLLKMPSPLRTARVETLAFSPDGRLLATCRRGSAVQIYR